MDVRLPAAKPLGFTRRLLVALLVVLALAAGQAAAQNPPMDFSDAEKPMVNWPFQVIEFWIDTDGLNVFQNTRVSESSEKVFQYFSDMKEARSSVGPFTVSGLGKLAAPGEFNVALTISNEKFKLHIKPDGTGAVLRIKSTPNAIVSGYFKRALYEYRLGNDMRVPVDRWEAPVF